MIGDRCCENCAKVCVGTVRVDSGYGGIDDFDCPEWESMSDDEIDLMNAGQCPRFEPIDWEKVNREEKEMLECMKELYLRCPFPIRTLIATDSRL